MEVEATNNVTITGVVITILTLVANWQMYKKMGREGWEGIIPFYSSYVLFDVLYGNGWKFLLYLVPIYNIYLIFKVNIDLAHGFNKSGAFGLGLTFLNTIFTCILGLSPNSVWGDGSSANRSADFIDRATDFVEDGVNSFSSRNNNDDASKLRELKKLYDEGILTEEEYETKRKNIIDKL